AMSVPGSGSVAVAANHQRRLLDLVQRLRLIKIAKGGAAGCVSSRIGLQQHIANGCGMRAFGQSCGRKETPEHCVGDRGDAILQYSLPSRLQGPRIKSRRGVGENESGQPMRVRCREALTDGPAHGDSAKSKLRNAERIREPKHV